MLRLFDNINALHSAVIMCSCEDLAKNGSHGDSLWTVTFDDRMKHNTYCRRQLGLEDIVDYLA